VLSGKYVVGKLSYLSKWGPEFGIKKVV
jgi:hypothetical protein